ncbi:MAG: endonuclease/exonuclease/phosphatase family protein [Pseudomonadota bacterium]
MPRASMKDLTFATFNLLNLQVPGGLTYSNTPPYPDDAEGRARYAAKIGWIADRLRLLDAEVIGFQELWSRAALEAAFAEAGMLADYDLVARDAPGRGRPQVALAVRKDRKGGPQLEPGADWVAGFPDDFRFDGIRETDGAEEEITITIDEFSRPVLAAVIQPEGSRPKPPPVRVYVAHLKSKGPARVSFARPRPPVLETRAQIARSALSHVRRVMEAGALRAMLDDVMRGEDEDELSPVIVIGDLNDDTNSVTNELISAQPSYRVVQKSRAGERSDRGLYSVERLQQYRSSRHVYYTHIFRHKRESLDHILVSEEFYDHSRKRRWSFREMEVYNDHLNREEFEEEGATDHGIVRAYFDWNPMPEEIDTA